MRNLLRFLSVSLWLFSGLLVSHSTVAQTTDPTRQRPIIRPSADTLPPPDSAANQIDVLVDSLAADVDTTTVSAAAQAEIYKIVPKKATIRSVILPGWGQTYNRQVWKVPLVAAGFTTFAIIITRFTANYQKLLTGYRTAYAVTRDANGDTITDPRYKTAIVEGYARPLDLNQLKQGTEFWRRWRDYNYIFAALFYGLNIVDANVSAHLKTFDISDSLTLRYAPTVIPAPTIGLVPGLKLTLAFKK